MSATTELLTHLRAQMHTHKMLTALEPAVLVCTKMEWDRAVDTASSMEWEALKGAVRDFHSPARTVFGIPLVLVDVPSVRR